MNDFQAYLFGVVSSIYDRCPESLRCFGAPSGGLAKTADHLDNFDLATTFDSLAREGADLFYKGEIAQKISQFSQIYGGHVTSKDLSNYEVVRRAPLTTTYHGAELFTNPAPSTGGVLIAFALRLLEAICPVSERENHGVSIPDLVCVMGKTNHARLESGLRMLDPAAFGILQDEAYLSRHRDEILAHPCSFRGTTHISVVDATGRAASVTLSNGEGCGRMLPGTGFMLNNMLGEEDINPRGFHEWPSGIRMCSMMAPSIIKHGNGELTVLGSGGSNRIRTAILQVVHNLVAGGMTLPQAINAPRVHNENEHLAIEGMFPDSLITQLSATYPDMTVWPDLNMFFGGVHAVSRSINGEHVAAGDPRRGGAARVI